MKKTCGALAISLMIATNAVAVKKDSTALSKECEYISQFTADFPDHLKKLKVKGVMCELIVFYMIAGYDMGREEGDLLCKDKLNECEKVQILTPSSSYESEPSASSYESRPTTPPYIEKMAKEREIEAIRQDERIRQHYQTQVWNNIRR